MEARADLHTHTTASDGTQTPTQVVEAARAAGLAAVGITDHDTIAGIEEAIEAGERLGVEVVPGVEITAMYGRNIEVHVLGYWIEHRDVRLREFLQTLVEARFERARKMVDLLRQAGVRVEFDRVKEIAGGGAIGRPHVARAICEAGAASSIDAAFGLYLRDGGPAYVPRHRVTPSEAVAVILQAGGVPCCAHVAKLGRDELVIDLMREGLRAIEVYHPDHSPVGTQFYRRFALARGLIATGGSDAHFAHDARHRPVGGTTVSYEVVTELKRAAGRVEV